MKETILILSCEHASPFIPKQWQGLFNSQLMDNPFSTHDPHAEKLTLRIAQELNCEYLLGNISRIILDLNKNLNHEHCFPEHIRHDLSDTDKNILINQYFKNYRQSFESLIQKHIPKNHQVLHLSIHTFNPIEKGIEHNAAIGLLYDPSRHAEKEVVRILNELLIKRTPYKVRLNYPRTGKSDNFTSTLRKDLSESHYLGIELECNAFLLDDDLKAQELYENVITCLRSLLELL
jgi:predicted N-formylglutamate amidohydrolase